MSRLVYLTAARRDIGQIQRHIAIESGSAAVGRGFVARLQAHCVKPASLPGTLGRARPELGPDLRSSPFRSYVVFFRYAGDALEVVGILHGRRDPDAYFEREADVR